MTREEAINYFKRSIAIGDTDDERQHNEALKMAIEALKREPCEDAISRQAVLEWCGDINMDVYTNEVKEYVLSLPLVTPKPKTGHWIDKKCSVCGCGSMLGLCVEKYCPNCGAKMVEPQESEEQA